MSTYRLYIATCIALVLIVVNQKGYTLEPGHPDLVGYKFFDTKLYLTKIWVRDDKQDPLIVEAELVLASSDLPRKLASKNFSRPEVLSYEWLGSHKLNASAIYLSRLPVKEWNHGKSVDDLLLEVKSKRSVDIKQQLLHWVLQRVDLSRFRKPKVTDHYNHALSYEFPVSDKFVLGAELLEAEWRKFDSERTIESELYIMSVEL